MLAQHKTESTVSKYLGCMSILGQILAGVGARQLEARFGCLQSLNRVASPLREVTLAPKQKCSQYLLRMIGLLLLGLVVAGCADSLASAEPTETPPTPIIAATPTPAPTSAPVEATLPASQPEPVGDPNASPPANEMRLAPTPAAAGDVIAAVDSVQVFTPDASPPQLHIVVQGRLPDNCTEINSPQVEHQENIFLITLTTHHYDDRVCTQTLVPYEQTIPLDAANLLPGEYAVSVNGLTSTFMVAAEQPTTEMAAPVVPASDIKATPNILGGFSQILIYLVALNDNGQNGQKMGCDDSLIAVERQVEPTIAPLRAAINELLSLKEQYDSQSGLYNALYQSELQIEDIEVTDEGTAVIRLTGDYSLGGVCDTPRFATQLEQTARQFLTVNDVAVFINDVPLPQALSLAGTPPETPAPTSPWTTYRVAQAYEIDYPQDLYSIQSGPASPSVLPPGLVILEPTGAFNSQQPSAVTYRITIAAMENSQNLSLDNPQTLFGRGPVMQYGPDLLAGQPVREISVAGVRAFRVDNLAAGQSGVTADILTFKDNMIYEIVVEPAQAAGDPEVNKAVFEEIISSFRFID